MTIALSANTPRISYTVAEGVTRTTPFNTDFIFFETSDISVFVDGVARTFDATTANTTQFTVSGGNGSTGSVTTTVTGATGGSTVVITRDIELKRTTDFPSSGAFEISKLNTELDTIIAITSDFNDSASRAIRLQDFDSAVSMELPLLASRKGTVLGFNATTGAVEAGPTITAVQSLADVTASINLLGTSDAVSDMNLLATSANVTAMGHLGTSANVTAMGLLGTSSNVTAMGKLGNDATVADMALLGTDATVADMAQLANSTIIDDLAQLANTTITDDMAILATTANVANMATLGASGVVGNIATVAGIQGNVTTVAGVSGNVTTVAGISTDVTAVAGVSSNVTTVAGVASNVTTVANNVTGVNSFAERYRVASSAPTSSLDVGDLYFDTTANELKVYKSSGWAAAGSTVNGTSGRFTYNITGTPTTLTGASGTGFAEANSATLAYDAGFIDVYLNGVKQVNGTDVTVTSGTSVVFASALSNGDVVDIVTFGTFNVAAINADNINSGTVPVARVSGSYTNITGTGALNAGSITSGFGNIDTGSSTITTTGAISGGSLTANGGVTIDNITIDGTEIDLSSGDLTLDVAGDLIIDTDGAEIKLKDDGTLYGKLQNSSSDFIIESSVQDKDILLKGNDGGSVITAMKIDMSEGGLVKIGDDDAGSAGTTGIQLQNSQDFATVYDGTNTNTFSGIQTVNTDETSNRTATGITFVHRTSSSGVASIQSTSTASDRADLRFVTRGSDGINERVRITNDGDFCVGTTSAGLHKGIVSGNTGGNAVFKAANTATSGNTTCYIAFMDGSGSASVNSAFFQGFNGSNNFYLLGNGTHTFTSDENAKKNIETTRDGYLEDLAKLRVVKYNWKEQEDGEDKELGLIAQEVEKVFPKLVMNDIDPQIEEKDKKKMIKTTVLPFMLLKALQEANTKITALETENKTQATQIADLISRVTALESA